MPSRERKQASNRSSDNCYIYNNLYLSASLERPLDEKILRLLVNGSTRAQRRGCLFVGYSVANIRRLLGMGKTMRAMGGILAALNILKRNGFADYQAHSKKRWHATTKGVTCCGFAEGSQKSLEEFFE